MSEHQFLPGVIVDITGINPADPNKVSIQFAIQQVNHNYSCRFTQPIEEATRAFNADRLKLYALSNVQTR